MKHVVSVTVVTLMTLWIETTALKLQENNECRLVTFIDFTDTREGAPDEHQDPEFNFGYGDWPDAPTLGKASFSMLAAAELARKHFNARDTAIVPELANFTDCPIMFADPSDGSSWYFDSAFSRSASVDHLLQLPRDEVCAVLGPREPRANEGVSVLAESLDVPLVAYATIDRRLARVQDFPTFVRVIPEAAEFASIVALYVQRDVFMRDYLAVLYDQSDYGEQFEDPLEDAEDALGYETITEHIVEGDDESLYESLGEVVDKGYRTILIATDRPAMINDIARVADELGLIGPGYFWIFSAAMMPPAMKDTIRFEVDSPADRMLRGSALFANYDSFVYNGETDSFLKEWRKQNASLVDHLNDIVPMDSNGSKFYVADGSYFQTETPTEYASFMYDSIIATGIGACEALAGDGDHYQNMLDSAFFGASGKVKFKKGEEDGDSPSNARDPCGPLFGVYNVRPGPVGGDGKRGYEQVLTSIHSHSYTVNARGEPVDGGWRNVPGTEFIFYDNTTEEPMPLRTVVDENLLSQGIQIAGLFLASLSMFIALATGLWVGINRNTRLIKASQPEFLYLLCFGAALVSASLFLISFDEGNGYTMAQLSNHCTAFPWLFCTGYLIMYASLFSKLWRLSKLLQMRRRAVGIKQVVLPFALIMTSCFIILIAWTALDPLQYERVEISDEPLETYAECQSLGDRQGAEIPYIVMIGALFAVIIGMTAAIAWKLKDVQSDLSESRWIFFGIFTHIQTWMVGIPVVVITDSVSRDASYIMYAALIFVFSVSMVTLVIWPKIYVRIRDKYFGGPPKKSVTLSVQAPGSTRVSGIHTGIVTSSEGMFTNASEASKPERIAALEEEVSQLKQELAKRESSGEIQEQHPAPAED